MRADDIGAFYDVRFSVKENRIHPHQVNLLDRDQLMEKIGQGGGWVCEHAGDIVGVCLPVLTAKPFICGLFVRPSCHARGIGRELLTRSVLSGRNGYPAYLTRKHQKMTRY